MKALKLIIFALCALSAVQIVHGKRLNEEVLNKPYADLRSWHLGFSIGTFAPNLLFTHNGYITPEGETWMIEQPDYSPGFCVNGLIDLRWGKNVNLRFTPGMYFGTRELKFREQTTGAIERQNLKSTFLVCPVDLKLSTDRYRNSRPYVTAGVMPVFDLAKKQNDYIKLKPTDLYLTVGLGSDFYLPYFKFIPEIKFCFGLMDVLEKDRSDLQDDPAKLKIPLSLSKATSRMIVLTFYFE